MSDDDGALWGRLCVFVDAHLTDQDLRPAVIAAAHHISPRLLRKVFQQHGETVTGRIRARRLEHCRLDLLDPVLAGRTVAAVGRSWGFTVPAHFTRVFRNTYGVPPLAYRNRRGA
jgi:AraC-like DNA-binding protein